MKDILVILMVAFGLFTILMFILFYVYIKKHYNDKHINDDYENDTDYYSTKKEIDNKKNQIKKNINDDEFIPKRKK